MKFRLLLLFSFCVSTAFAQSSFYTYLTDKKIRDQTDLFGYNFVPSKLEIPNDRDEDLGAGEYTFGVTRSNLYVEGEGVTGVYNVNNISPTEYGFKMTLMNSRDPRLQGHLKIILVNKVYVDALVFKASKDDPEMIFMLPEMNDALWENEKSYFTDKYETELEYETDIWGTTIRPFFRNQMGGNRAQKRLQMKDSTYISFIEETIVIDKTKPVKAEKPKKEKKKKKKGVNIETGEIPDELLSEDEEADEEVEEEADEGMDAYPDDNEGMDAYPDDEEEYPEEEEEEMDDKLEEDNKKVKVIIEHYIEVRTIRNLKDGTIDDSVERFKVKDTKEREDEAATGGAERFQIEFDTNRGPMHLYLTGKRTISSFEVGGERYLMRGH